jgi:DNA-directed RNA polymerase specialized sigma24 family protein
VLSVYERLSYQEIAAVMGCSVASVESRLHRAKENLAKKLLERMK